MISVEEAQRLILNASFELSKESRLLEESMGKAMSQPFHASMSLPDFRQSAMDGYAVNLDGNTYSVIGEVPAGSRDPDMIPRELPAGPPRAGRGMPGAAGVSQRSAPGQGGQCPDLLNSRMPALRDDSVAVERARPGVQGSVR